MARSVIRGITRIIACEVFKPALGHIRLEERYPDVRVTYLPSNLHIKPQELRNRLLKEITNAKNAHERVVCLYGDCFPGIERFCRRQEVVKVPGHYCYEMLLGRERFRELIDEVAGTYFLERDLITNFQEYCMEPLELHDEEIRKYCFEHYERIVYVRQPSDPDLLAKASEHAAFLELSLEIEDADYSYLEQRLRELM